MNLSQELVKNLFDYDAKSGRLIWRSRQIPVKDWVKGWNIKWAGKPVGSSKEGRKGWPSQTRINGTLYQVHKLVWLYHYGYWPKYIDHINGDNHDNRIENLREATHLQNMANRNRYERGVHKQKGRFRARIGYGYKRIHLGYFTTREQALAAYREASVKLHGEFSSYNRSPTW